MSDELEEKISGRKCPLCGSAIQYGGCNSYTSPFNGMTSYTHFMECSQSDGLDESDPNYCLWPGVSGPTIDEAIAEFDRMTAVIALIRAETLEEAARVCGLSSVGLHFAAVIRALKDKP